MKVYTNFVQYSPDYWEHRRGKPSASDADRILTPGCKPSSQQHKYICKLIADLMCFDPPFMTEQQPRSAAIRRGLEFEPESRNWYAMEKNVEVLQVGGCETDDARFWASPDGLVGDDGVLELKNPDGDTHTEYLLEGILPPIYKPQCHFLLLVTGRKWVDFCSYRPGLPGLIIRVVPDSYTTELRVQAEVFYAKFQAALAKIKAL